MLEKNHIWLRISITALLVLVLGVLARWIFFLYAPLISDESGYRYIVKPGVSMSAVTDDLSALNIVQHPSLFKLLVKIKHNSNELKFGEYLFPKGTNAVSLLEQITTGKGVIYHLFTIIPGWSFKDLRAALTKDSALTHATNQLSDTDIMSAIGSAHLHPEGEFYPDTYFFTLGASDISLLKRAHRTMQEKLNAAWEQRDSSIPYKTAYQALIVASLIEKEAQISLDRALISGVIMNRLNKNMLLQIDPTVIYGIGDRYDGVIHRADLLKDTPYNTYVQKGLPPTPIAMPSAASIDAAMHPKIHDYYYFVVRHKGEAAHQFSKTLAEHNQAVSTAKNSYSWFFNTELLQSYFNSMQKDSYDTRKVYHNRRN